MTRTMTLDFPQYARTTVGFDRLFNEINRTFDNSKSQGYPPYNVIELNEDEWMISIAVAGFDMKDLGILLDKNILSVESMWVEDEPRGVKYLHKGIANRKFQRTFTLADYVEVESATLELGMLNIHLKRNVPEALQPKRIPISAEKTVNAVKKYGDYDKD